MTSYLVKPNPTDPRLTRRVEGVDQNGEPITTSVPMERPLTLYLNGQEIVTMMTIGDFPDYLGVGYLISGAAGMLIALLIGGGMNLFSYWNADKIVLKMYRAQPVDENHPNAVVRNYVADVRQMARDAGLPQPQVAIIPNDQ
ncbi:MAG: hypothetical protein ACOVVK_17375, partial [Elsteraceae bacterium]